MGHWGSRCLMFYGGHKPLLSTGLEILQQIATKWSYRPLLLMTMITVGGLWAASFGRVRTYLKWLVNPENGGHKTQGRGPSEIARISNTEYAQYWELFTLDRFLSPITRWQRVNQLCCWLSVLSNWIYLLLSAIVGPGNGQEVVRTRPASCTSGRSREMIWMRFVLLLKH